MFRITNLWEQLKKSYHELVTTEVPVTTPAPMENTSVDFRKNYFTSARPFNDILLAFKTDLKTVTSRFDVEMFKIKLSEVSKSGTTRLGLNLEGNQKYFENFIPYFKMIFLSLILDFDKSKNKNSLHGNSGKVTIEAFEILYFRLNGSKRNKFYLNTRVVTQNYGIECKFVKNEDVDGILTYVSSKKFGDIHSLIRIDMVSRMQRRHPIYFNMSLNYTKPNNAVRFMLRTSDYMCTYQEYWKISDNLEAVVSMKSRLTSPKFVGQHYQLGFKFKDTKYITYGLKLDLDGNLAAGAWFRTKEVKVSLFGRSNVLQSNGVIEDVGFSIEF